MHRREFVSAVGIAGAATLAAGRNASQAQENAPVNRVPVLANDHVVIYESPDPKRVYAYTPGICRLPSGRLVATLDRGGPGVAELPGVKRDGELFRGMIFASDDRGKTWALRAETPMLHARPFVAGKSVYVLGHSRDIRVVRSDDDGETWSEAAQLTDGQSWHQSACNVQYADGKVYLVMERNTNTDPNFRGWAVSKLAPVLMAAKVGDDLTRRQSWTFASELSFNQAIEAYGKPHMIGVPFYEVGNTAPDNPGDRRYNAPIGWLETNVVRFTDPNHIWYDADGRTFHLWMRAHTGTTNLACIAKVVEAEDGSLTTSLETAPTGEPMLYAPCPGGQMRFHILHDEPTNLFWLLSSQSTDSMTRPELLPANRFNLPNNERHRLALHFSTNCIDWCFAGMVAMTDDAGQARHYASMVIDGDDLHVVSRSGDARAKSAHDGNLITFHTVRGFRELAY